MIKKNKATRIAEMLKAGESVRVIRRMLGVSEAYVYLAKKRMQTEVAEVIEPKPEPEVKAAKEVGTLLDERGARYGNFLDQARISQRLKNVAHQFAAEHDKHFDVDQAEALDMIFAKIGRILNGDPNYADSWIDIAGYAKLVADRLEGRTR